MFDKLEILLEYKFKDASLLERALTHPSVVSRFRREKKGSYERLEFLGDAVLNYLITDSLYTKYTEDNEGKLAIRRSKLVGKCLLSEIAKVLCLGDFIIMSAGENNTGGRHKCTNLENVLEALIGAVYLDGGMAKAGFLVDKLFGSYINDSCAPTKDIKTTLQEWVHKNRKTCPNYKLVSQQGPAHSPIFTMSVSITGYEDFIASGPSKSAAEKNAAKLLWEYIKNNQEKINDQP